jgi:hypothetical protein
MNDETNTENDQDLTEDTEGHGRFRMVKPVDETGDDAEGHGFRRKIEDADDTEGHGRFRGVKPADEDAEDTEGHGRLRF